MNLNESEGYIMALEGGKGREKSKKKMFLLGTKR